MIAAAIFLCLSATVYDGDTFRCSDGLRVRLWGVSAVELRDPGGKEARQALRDIAGGRDLLCELKGASAGRVVALCRVLGPDVAREMVPPTQEQAEDWIAMMQAACARRPDSEASAAVAFALYVGELRQWPADVARQACMTIARGTGASGTNWFPTLAELSQACARLAAPRRAMMEALKGKAPKAIEKFPVSIRREPTEDEIARVQRMKDEALKQLDDAAERSKPKPVPLPAIHGKADEGGLTAQMRELLARQRGEDGTLA